MPIAINGSGTVTGISVGGLPDGIVDTDMIAASAVTAAKSSGLATSNDLGLSDFDTWYITASVASNQDPLENNWSRWTSHGGTGSVTFAAPSSGVWTFPSTGYWLIMFTAYTYKNNGSERGCNTSIYVTTNNSSYNFAAEASTNIHEVPSNNSKGHVMLSYILDVTDTSQVKIKLAQGYQASGTVLYGHGSYLFTNVKFLKLRET